MNRITLVNGLGLQPRAAVSSSWFTAELRRVHGPHLIPVSARNRTYKQLQLTVTRHRGDVARAPLHFARAPRITDEMLIAAVDVLVSETPSGELMPNPLDKKVHRAVARAVAETAIRQGIARAEYVPYVEE